MARSANSPSWPNSRLGSSPLLGVPGRAWVSLQASTKKSKEKKKSYLKGSWQLAFTNNKKKSTRFSKVRGSIFWPSFFYSVRLGPKKPILKKLEPSSSLNFRLENLLDSLTPLDKNSKKITFSLFVYIIFSNFLTTHLKNIFQRINVFLTKKKKSYKSSFMCHQLPIMWNPIIDNNDTWIQKLCAPCWITSIKSLLFVLKERFCWFILWKNWIEIKFGPQILCQR